MAAVSLVESRPSGDPLQPTHYVAPHTAGTWESLRPAAQTDVPSLGVYVALHTALVVDPSLVPILYRARQKAQVPGCHRKRIVEILQNPYPSR